MTSRPELPRLILATASPYKRELMARLDLPFEAVGADVDESALPDEAPMATALRLARAKAAHLGQRYDGAFVIGADQVISLDGVRLSKPGTVEAACEQLSRQAGRCHDLYTAVAVHTPEGTIFDEIVHFAMEMRPLTPSEIELYVDTDRPLDCAGSYKIEAGGIRLFRAMRGEDYTAIIGLPLTRVWALLDKSGYFAARAAGAP
jgi:septum formation protein